jgi:HEPN domain-containing protein
VLLHDARAKVTHPDAPVTLLLAHAIELYLKAFLRLRGVGIDEVKNSFGHDFKKLVDEASSRGLSLVEADMDIAAILTEKESIRRSRYIETGYYQRPGLAALSRTCRGLDQSVSATLRDAGMTIQSTELNHIEAD